MNMKIYHYHPKTGEFLGQSSAIPDPLEESRFLIPAYATEKQVSSAGKNEVAVFDGQEWHIKPDFRGTVYWLSHGEKHTIKEIGDTVPDGAFLEEPEAPELAPIVPQQVTNAQGATALVYAGLWGAVLAYVDAMTDPTEKALAEVALHRTTHWSRTSPFLNGAATALGLSSEDLDNLFIQASEIEL